MRHTRTHCSYHPFCKHIAATCVFSSSRSPRSTNFRVIIQPAPSPVRALHVPRALSFSFLPELGFFHSVRGIFQLSCSLFPPFIHRGKIALKNASLRRDKRRGSFIGRDLSLPDLARFAIARINRVAVYNGRTRALPPSVFRERRGAFSSTFASAFFFYPREFLGQSTTVQLMEGKILYN